MREALALAGQSAHQDEVPVGAVIVIDGVIAGRGSNAPIARADPTAHAEILAIRAASQILRSETLRGLEIYTTCEPCPMCLGALYWAELDRVLFAVSGDEAARFYPGERRYHRAVDFYAQYTLPFAQRRLPMQLERREEGVRLFEHWKDLN